MRARFAVLKMVAKAAPAGLGVFLSALFGVLETMIAEIEALKRRGNDGN